MKRLALILLVPAIAVFMGCRSRTFTDSEGNQATVTHDGNNAEIKVEAADGNEAQIAVGGSGVPLPKELPEDFPIFSDATAIGTTVASEGLMIALQTNTQPEAVINFYEQELATNDWQITDTARIPGGAFFMANKGDERSVNVSIGGSDEGGAVITITMETSEN